MGRRLGSSNRSVGMEERIVAIDKFSQKMVNSGHAVKTVRIILVSGLKGYKRIVIRSVAKNIPLHRSAGQSAAAKRTKKLLAKSNWFRQKSNDPTEGDESKGGVADRKGVAAGGKARQAAQESSEKAKAFRTTTVMFIEFS